MAQEPEYGDGQGADLAQFEKNRFYQGKLMTPRDMEAEQEYHAERLHTVTRFLAGTGVLRGLEVEEITATEDGVDVTLAPGLAIDGAGRPIVVDQATSKSLPAPSGDEIYLHIRYDEVALESVPVPDTQGTGEDDHAPNRAIEVFELTYQETPPEPSSIPDVDLPGTDGAMPDPSSAAHELARRYHERHRVELEDEDPGVFLGSFERGPDGDWTPMEDGPARPHVYDPEFLYAALIDHVTDTENPHRTSVDESPAELPEELDDIGAVTRKLDFLEERLEELEAAEATTTNYVMRKSLKDTVRHFEELAERLEGSSGDGSRLAREVAVESRRKVRDGAATDPDAFRAHARELLELFIDLGEALGDATSEADLERYLKAVSELQEVLEGEPAVVDVAEPLDAVSESADSLEVLVDVVPDA